MQEKLYSFVVLIGILAILFFGLGYTFLKKLRIQTLELLFILTLSFLPLGIILRYAQQNNDLSDGLRILVWTTVGLTPVAFVFIGGSIGLRWADRYKIKGRLARIGFIVLGVQSLPGFVSGSLALVLTPIKLFLGTSIDNTSVTWSLIGLLWVGSPWILYYLLFRRIRFGKGVESGASESKNSEDV